VTCPSCYHPAHEVQCPRFITRVVSKDPNRSHRHDRCDCNSSPDPQPEGSPVGAGGEGRATHAQSRPSVKSSTPPQEQDGR